jgi:2-polyprenyl-6-methoxyphenol hydroxylase-like FAD-dependent oxidoreductase
MSGTRRVGPQWPNTCFIESQHPKTEHQLDQQHAHILWWFVRRPFSYYERHQEGLMSRRTVGNRRFIVWQDQLHHAAVGVGADSREFWRVDYQAINSRKGFRILEIRFSGDFERFKSDLCIVKLFRDRKRHRKVA